MSVLELGPITLLKETVAFGAEGGPGLLDLGLDFGGVGDEGDLLTVLNPLHGVPCETFWDLEADPGGHGNVGTVRKVPVRDGQGI